MSKPKIVDRKPIKVAIQKGQEHYWCAFGESKT